MTVLIKMKNNYGGNEELKLVLFHFNFISYNIDDPKLIFKIKIKIFKMNQIMKYVDIHELRGWGA